MASHGDVNTLLESLAGSQIGDESHTSQQLFALIYDELYLLAQSRMRHERPGHTLQPTALVNEVYLRIVSSDRTRQWDNTRHFFAAAARAMRQILIDNARRKLARKRDAGGNLIDVSIDEVTCIFDDHSLLELHDALLELEREDPLKAKLVELRFFGGLDIDRICCILDISRSTAHRYWKQARARLFLKISGSMGI